MLENRPVVKSDVLSSELSGSIASVGKALGDDQGDVVVLLVGAEPADFVNDGGEKIAGRKRAVAAQSFHQALFAELLAMGAKCLGNAIGVKRQGVARKKLAFFDVAFPFLERAQNRRGGAEPIERIIRAKE